MAATGETSLPEVASAPLSTSALQLRGVSLVLTAAMLWSTSGLFIKVMTLHSLTFAGWRAVFASLTFLPFVRWRAIRLNGAMVLLVLAYGATMVGFVYSTRFTTAVNAIALQATAPAWVFLYTCISLRRVPLVLLWPVGAILGGIFIMLSETGEGDFMLGNIIALGTGLIFATTHVTFTRIGQPPAGALLATNLLVAVICLSLSPGPIGVGITAGEWASLIFLGSCQIALGFLCFVRSLRFIPVPQASMLTLLEPILNPIWVFLAIGETPSINGATGLLLILGGLSVDTLIRVWRPELRRFSPSTTD